MVWRENCLFTWESEGRGGDARDGYKEVEPNCITAAFMQQHSFEVINTIVTGSLTKRFQIFQHYYHRFHLLLYFVQVFNHQFTVCVCVPFSIHIIEAQ